MAIHALLTVDLNQVTDAQRQAFYLHLTNNHWVRLKLTTTFKATFTPTSTADGALAATRTDIQGAANASGVRSYEVALQLGEIPLQQWKQP
jgi:hypothetical protein